MTQIYTILFDLDGTIVNTAPDLMAAHNHVMKKFGHAEKKLSDIKSKGNLTVSRHKLKLFKAYLMPDGLHSSKISLINSFKKKFESSTLKLLELIFLI